MFANARQSIADWIFRARTPESPPVTLVQRRIFILPTRQGYLFAGVLLVLLPILLAAAWLWRTAKHRAPHEAQLALVFVTVAFLYEFVARPW